MHAILLIIGFSTSAIENDYLRIQSLWNDFYEDSIPIMKDDHEKMNIDQQLIAYERVNVSIMIMMTVTISLYSLSERQTNHR